MVGGFVRACSESKLLEEESDVVGLFGLLGRLVVPIGSNSVNNYI